MTKRKALPLPNRRRHPTKLCPPLPVEPGASSALSHLDLVLGDADGHAPGRANHADNAWPLPPLPLGGDADAANARVARRDADARRGADTVAARPTLSGGGALARTAGAAGRARAPLANLALELTDALLERLVFLLDAGEFGTPEHGLLVLARRGDGGGRELADGRAGGCDEHGRAARGGNTLGKVAGHGGVIQVRGGIARGLRLTRDGVGGGGRGSGPTAARCAATLAAHSDSAEGGLTRSQGRWGRYTRHGRGRCGSGNGREAAGARIGRGAMVGRGSLVVGDAGPVGHIVSLCRSCVRKGGVEGRGR